MKKHRDFKIDKTKKRDDSPVRSIPTVHSHHTHDQRIRWLLRENRDMYKEHLTASFFVSVAKLKYNGKRKVSTNLKEHKAIKEAEALWKECLEMENVIWDLEIENWKQTERYQQDPEPYFGFFEDEYEH